MKICYSDFTYTIHDYFSLLKKREIMYEFIIPALLSWIFYIYANDLLPNNSSALSTFFCSFVSLLVNVFAILVGFTISAVAIFTTVDHANNKILNAINSERKIATNSVTNFRFVYANLIYTAFASIAMLVFTLSCNILYMVIFEKALLTVLIFGSLHVLFLSLRNITTLYFSFAYPDRRHH